MGQTMPAKSSATRKPLPQKHFHSNGGTAVRPSTSPLFRGNLPPGLHIYFFLYCLLVPAYRIKRCIRR